VLVWWSRDYAQSRFCMEELRLAWMMSRRHPASEGKRIWILNPEDPRLSADHIRAGDLEAYSFLRPPEPPHAVAWVESRRADLKELARFGPLAAVPEGASYPPWYGEPLRVLSMVGRSNELWRTHSAMFPQQIGGAVAPPLVHLHGTAGIGKSALASHYAATFATAYPAGVWWLNMAARGEIRSFEDAGLAWLWALEQALHVSWPGLLATLTRDSQGRALPAPIVRERVHRYLSAQTGAQPYLWVVEKLPFIEDGDLRAQVVALVRAPTLGGRTLITTRDALPLSEALHLPLAPLPQPDGEALLGSYLAPAQRRQQRQLISELVAEVGGHPLALILLGRRVAHSSLGLAPVLQDVRKTSALDSLERTWPLFRKELGKSGRSVLAAIQLSLEGSLDDDARHLLALASICSPHSPIPTELLMQAFSEWMSDTSLLRFELATGVLVRASLVVLNPTDRQDATVQPLVSAVARQTLIRAPNLERASVTAVVLARLEPLGTDPRAFLRLRADAPHALSILAELEADSESAMPGRNLVRLAIGLSRLQDALGLPIHALTAARQAESLALHHLAADDRDLLRAKTVVCGAMTTAGLLTDVAERLKLLLPSSQRLFGPADEDVLAVKSLLADAYFALGRLELAQQLQEDLVQELWDRHELRDRALVPVMLSLATTLHRRELVEDAHAMAEAAYGFLAEQESNTVLHPDGVIALHNLAAIRLDLGDIVGAAELQEAVVSMAEGVFGVDHPRTRLARSTLADALVSNGRHDLAIQLYQKVLAANKGALGAEYPEELWTVGRLIATHLALSQNEQARVLHERFVQSAALILPAGHPDSLAAVRYLAGELRRRGLPIADLLPLLYELVRAGLREHGLTHKDTGDSLGHLLAARTQAGVVGATLESRDTALVEARARKGSPVDRALALLIGHHELIAWYREAGNSHQATHAEALAVADLQIVGPQLTHE